MCETRWYFGYRCEIVSANGEHYWYVEVAVPRWHPVRTLGFHDALVLLLRGGWKVFTDGGYARREAFGMVYDMARGLRVMQMEWDQLSPYEREYRIWCFE